MGNCFKKIIAYRTSDKGNPKEKLPHLNRYDYLERVIDIFRDWEFIFILDNVTEETLETFESRYEKKGKIINTALGNSGSYNFMIEYIISNHKDGIVYLLEDDYLHLPGSSDAILEGLEIADYVTLYDHPDKYTNGINPLVKNNSEQTRVYLSNLCHWKETNSTTMTFATRIKTLEKDIFFHKLFTVGVKPLEFLSKRRFGYKKIPMDYPLWRSLILIKRRKLISSIPAYSTHAEVAWISPKFKI